jgi:hypothetical protein
MITLWAPSPPSGGIGQSGAHDVGLLRGAVDGELIEAAHPLGHNAATFEWAHGLARSSQLARHGDGGLGLHGLEVDVGGRGQEQVVAPVLVHQRRSRLAAGQHVGHHRQRLEVDIDLGGKVFCLGPRGGHAHGDELAHVAHLDGGEHRLHRGLEARQRGVGANRRHAGKIVGDEHAVADGGRDADRFDAGVCQGAPKERHLLHPGQTDVANILAAPAHVAVVLLAEEARADALLSDVLCHARSSPSSPNSFYT